MRRQLIRQNNVSVIPSAPQSKVAFAYETLKEQILSGRLVAGSSLVQSKIAKELNISPIPVMAAVRQLVAEGLVTQKPHHAAVVAEFPVDGLQETTTIRIHLEILAVRLSVPQLGEAELEGLRAISKDMKKALAASNLPLYGELNKKFRLKLYESCPNRLLAQMVKNLWDDTDRRGLRASFTKEEARVTQQNHKFLVAAIEKRDVDIAARLIENHKQNFRNVTVTGEGL